VSQFHVNQIETHIRSLFEATHWKSELDNVNNLSRLLGLYGVHQHLGAVASDPATLIEITDGTEDRGIDAIGVDPAAKTVVLVQSKWRQDGTSSLSLADVLKFLDGVKSLIGMKSDDAPVHASEAVRTAVRDLLKTPGARIALVTATTGADPLADAVVAPITDLLNQLNDIEVAEPLAAHTHLDQAALFNSLAEKARPSVDLDLQMLDWGRASEPQRIFYGRVSAAEVAQWYASHGTGLFAENIRVVIPRSDINDGILRTIVESPDQFIYFNNGITILASSITQGAAGALNRDVGYFKLTSASVVNGAQTVSTLGSALGGPHQDQLGSAFVLVRCIEVPDENVELGRQITRFANTQNEVSSQDFAFLDQEQHRLARELQVLGYEYILRASELPKSKEKSKVIELRQAAVGLACASANLSHAVTAKREVSRLFTEPGIYKALFNPSTDPLRLARAVQITEKIDTILDAVEATTDGVKAGVAVHGRRVIAHRVMRDLGDSFLSDPNVDLKPTLDGLKPTVAGWVDSIVANFPANAYPGNVFKNQARVSELFK
jgi:AIPR protein